MLRQGKCREKSNTGEWTVRTLLSSYRTHFASFQEENLEPILRQLSKWSVISTYICIMYIYVYILLYKYYTIVSEFHHYHPHEGEKLILPKNPNWFPIHPETSILLPIITRCWKYVIHGWADGLLRVLCHLFVEGNFWCKYCNLEPTTSTIQIRTVLLPSFFCSWKQMATIVDKEVYIDAFIFKSMGVLCIAVCIIIAVVENVGLLR